ncbi:hypothetical protein SDC9_197062 [bioreactor metagenome]|uniref:Uncharacterized protein n=1 Tax=bioreactor metagenome TaxID=1076179 RepID=A0A645IDN3_9ZZZZ
MGGCEVIQRFGIREKDIGIPDNRKSLFHLAAIVSRPCVGGVNILFDNISGNGIIQWTAHTPFSIGSIEIIGNGLIVLPG